MRSVKRLLCLLLALCLMLGSAWAEDENAEAPAATEVPTAAPTAVPTAAPTAEPTKVPATPEPTEAPTPEPTKAPTAAPTAEPTGAPTEEPAEEPTDEPTQAPTATPTETPEAEITEKPWDESSCKHNTADCERAPKCDIPGCKHIVKDAHGLDVPACKLGTWLLEAQDEPVPPIMTMSVRAEIINLNTADATIYRSGTYRVRGGNLRPGASLRIAKNRMVVLQLEDAAIGTVTLEKGSMLYISTSGLNTLETLTSAGSNTITFTEGGALTITEVKNSDEKSEAVFEVLGGSLRAPIADKAGRTMYVFPGSGARSVKVNGAEYLATPHADGSFYLWLGAPVRGMKWEGTVSGGTLAIAQSASLPQNPTGGDITQGTSNTLQSGTYELSGNVQDGTKLVIGQSGVTVSFKGVTATGDLIDATAAYTLIVSGENTVESLTGSGAVTLQGDGFLKITGSLPASVVFESGSYDLPSVPAGYAPYTVGVALKNQKVTLDGKAYPLLVCGGQLLLPSVSGKDYAISADATSVTVRTLDAGELAFTLSAANSTADAGSAKAFTVMGDGSSVSGKITASGATASATFKNVQLEGGSGLIDLSNEYLTVTLTGDNTLQSSENKAITLSGSTLSLNVTSGRLALRGQSDLTGITLRGNILVEPAPSQSHTALMIRDKSGNPVPNKELTVSIGGQTWRYTTHYDGSLHLWGLGNISGQDIAATDGSNVYTAVVMNNQADVTTGLTDFGDVTFTSQPDGSLTVKWSVTGAKTTGIQLQYGKAAIDMPDTYVSGAQHIDGSKSFTATVKGIPSGSVVTVRVYATEASGAAFNEKTVDGFQFGKIYTHTHKVPWLYTGKTGAADANYTGKAYEPKIDLPAGAVITYSGNDLVNGKPVYPGEYIMYVTVQNGDDTYAPGTVAIPFTIRKLVITITPAVNLQKYQGSPDPEFEWTAKGLLEGDTVYGSLYREAGEDVGEYKWLTSGFLYPQDYYTIRINPDAEPFVILPNMAQGGGFLNVQVNEVLNPVEQTITLTDGRKLSVLLTAQETLKIGTSSLGNLVRNEADEARLFTPQLSWNPDTDEVLLMLRAEPEMSEDHGYQTDSMGNPLWGVRRMRISGGGLEHMDSLGLTALTLINKEASLTCRIEDFLTDEMTELIKEAGGQMSNAIFYLTVEPVQEIPEELQPVTDGWTVSAVMKIGNQEYDVTPMLPGLTVAVDLEPVAELLDEMELYDEELFPAQFLISLADGTFLETTFVEPFGEDELEKASFPSMMYVSRYLSAPVTAAGTVYAVNAPVEEDEETSASLTASAE